MIKINTSKGESMRRGSATPAPEAVRVEKFFSQLPGIYHTIESSVVIMDRGIAAESHLAWLIDHQYRYPVVSRQRNHQFDTERSLEVVNKSAGSQKSRLPGRW